MASLDEPLLQPLTQEEKQEAFKKSKCIDRVFLGNSGTYPAIVAVPLQPKTPEDKERWVTVGAFGVNQNVKQPDPEKKVLCSHVVYGCCPTYWYADEVPTCLALTIIFTVLCSILLTPLSLLCFIPAAIQLKKAKQAADAGDIDDSRKHCQNWKWFCCGLCVWFWILFIPYFIVVLTVILLVAL